MPSGSGSTRNRSMMAHRVLLVLAVSGCLADGKRELVPTAPPITKPRCPVNTYPRFAKDWGGTHKHCVCPDHFVCEGCSEGCTQEKSLFKMRCVRGFKPDCESCRCSPLQKSAQDRSLNMVGNYIDRRSLPFCRLNATMKALVKEHKYNGDYNFIFVISNGHTGTTHLGQTSNWRRMFGDIKSFSEIFITHEMEADKQKVKTISWYGDYCATALDYVINEKLPKMTSVLDATKKNIYFQSGHQVILGLVPALIQILGDSAKFIRLRRNKLDVAYSYAQKAGGPCTARCIFCLCPLDSATKLAVTGDIWEQFSVYQKYLWFVDEVEAQWQSLLLEYPDINRVELDWNKTLTPEHFTTIAHFAGLTAATPKGQEKVSKSNQHLTAAAKSHKNVTWMEEQSVEYARIAGLKRCSTYTCIGPLKAK